MVAVAMTTGLTNFRCFLASHLLPLSLSLGSSLPRSALAPVPTELSGGWNQTRDRRSTCILRRGSLKDPDGASGRRRSNLVKCELKTDQLLKSDLRPLWGRLGGESQETGSQPEVLVYRWPRPPAGAHL